eukprot:GEMP01042714.1.p1 GENE.GEMP01042714.1~~GEMP01042714.1.p1  ORF type:complete len:390 (+),score=95.02 GEMP01042714.1:40-1209(+)
MEGDQVASFMGITGVSTPDEAKNFLDMAGGDLSQAVSLYMDIQGGASGTPTQQTESEVRAPLESFQDQIIDLQQEQRNAEKLVEQDAAAMATRMQFDNEEKGDSRPSVLNSLFAAPAFSEKKTWFECMQLGKETQRWILVNIQDKELFESHVLNRDVWNDETIQEIISGNFVFWQRDTESVEGMQFCQCYKIDVQLKTSLPHVGVVDPRTGRLVKSWNAKKWDGPHVAADFFYSFLDRHSLSVPPSIESSKRPSPETSPSPREEKIEPVAQRVKEDSPRLEALVPEPPAAPDPAPQTVAQTVKEDQLQLPSVDESKPVTQVQIRFGDGSKRAFQFNEEHLVADLYTVVASVLCTREFQICGGFPPKPIVDHNSSLRTAGLCQSSVTVRQ